MGSNGGTTGKLIEPLGPLNEVLENIQEKAVQAAGAVNKVQVIELPGEPDYVYGVVTPDGKL